MDNRKQAEHVVDNLLDPNGAVGGYLEQVDLVESALNEAEARGRKAGLEEAARLFEGHEQTFKTDDDEVALTYRVMLIIAENIRALMSSTACSHAWTWNPEEEVFRCDKCFETEDAKPESEGEK